ncbi:MAG TPA: hypothetical protein PK006_10355 [Saprospiraceae bacterium]|nr:hypothetical protein [Saprospiraceae bacterium]
MQSQVTNGTGGSGSVGGFNQGVSTGSRSSVPFIPGSVNNPSGKLGPNNAIRNVYWVHGLNGDIDSWLNPAQASEYNVAPGFPARKINSISDITYGQSSGVLQAGNQLEDALNRSPSQDRTKDIVIAHSQGGIVSRGLLHNTLCLFPRKKTEELPMGGLVTFCSPHQGAELLNNKTLFSELAEEMCKDLLLGPSEEFVDSINIRFKIFGLVPIKISGSKFVKYVETGVGEVCKTFGDNVVPFILDLQTPNITKDYEVGAKVLANMNSCLDGNDQLVKFPKVAFFGVEPPRHLMLRTVKYFVESCQNYDYFDANDDMTLIDAFTKNYYTYLGKYIEYVSKVIIAEDAYNGFLCHTWWNYSVDPCPFLRHRKQNLTRIRDGYLKGVQFLQSMDDKYKIIIGALKLNKTTKLYCKCEGSTEYTEDEISDPWQCPRVKKGQKELLTCYTEEKTTYNRVEYDSDGVVLASSASNLPGATFGPQLMDNTSHMQARNNKALKLGLLKLYNGGTDLFFRTLPK